MKTFKTLANLCSVLGGALMTALTLITVVSLLGRNLIGATLAGDFELTGLVTGAAISMFMPLCQLRRANIIVDFFTSGMSERTNARLDRLAALVMTTLFILVAWRTGLGGINSFQSATETQILGVPEWPVYALMVPSFVLAALIAMSQAIAGTPGNGEVRL